MKYLPRKMVQPILLRIRHCTFQSRDYRKWSLCNVLNIADCSWNRTTLLYILKKSVGFKLLFSSKILLKQINKNYVNNFRDYDNRNKNEQLHINVLLMNIIGWKDYNLNKINNIKLLLSQIYFMKELKCLGYFFTPMTNIFYNISNHQLMITILLKTYRLWWNIIHVHHLNLDKIHTRVAGCSHPSRFTPKTCSIFYVTCAVLTVDWTTIVTFSAIHTRHFTAFIEI